MGESLSHAPPQNEAVHESSGGATSPGSTPVPGGDAESGVELHSAGDRDISAGSARYHGAVHWLAKLLTVAVFPLIWVGGLVTTYDAGMAVPDWPGTYGWNMFAYPPSTWLFGPFDLLVEHSHRLLGTVAGFLSIGLVVVSYYCENRSWFRHWAVLILVAVIVQGALGGARVLLDERMIAMIHGCFGPLFFAAATATAVMSSRWWIERQWRTEATTNAHGRPWLAWMATTLWISCYGQLVLGAQLRHVTGWVSPRVFTGFVHGHLAMAGLVLLLVLVVALAATLQRATPKRVAGPARWLVGLVFLQISLGIGTWIVNYALPWPEMHRELAAYTILAKGYWESFVVTAHMATGSLIISFATVVALRAWRSQADKVSEQWTQPAM